MNIYRRGVKVLTNIGKHQGIITGCIIRGNDVFYEVSVFVGGDYRKHELHTSEFTIIGRDKKDIQIGFKQSE
jgi:hypothetical protein